MPIVLLTSNSVKPRKRAIPPAGRNTRVRRRVRRTKLRIVASRKRDEAQKHHRFKNFPELVQGLTTELRNTQKRLRPDQRWIVGLAGAPGSGKSTISKHLCQKLNSDPTPNSTPLAAVVPMDGFHYYMRELEQMDDPEEAKLRRGAHWTFDAHAFLSAIQRLRLNSNGAVHLPSYDHNIRDPVQNDIHVDKGTQIVIIEGNYLLIDVDPWNQIPSLLDVSWFAQCDVEVAKRRVYERHVMTGDSPEMARRRVLRNDGLNAQLVNSFGYRADVIFNSDC